MSWGSATAFYHQLGVIIKAGLPINQALEHAGTTAAGWHRDHAPRWSQGCSGGRTLAEQLRESGEKTLPQALILAGEKSGRLPEMCEDISAFYKHCIDLRRLVIGRLIYPFVLVHAAMMIPAVPAVFIGNQPAISILYGPGIFWAVIAALLIFAALSGKSGLLGRLALKFPLRGLALPLITSNTCLVMRAGISAGMLHHQSLELAADACGNRHFGARIRAAAGDLASGSLPNLTQAFARLGFKLEVVQLCQNGEISGQLDDAMGRCAEFQRTAFQERTLWTARIFTGTLYTLAVLAAAATVIGMYGGYLNTVKEMSEGMD